MPSTSAKRRRTKARKARQERAWEWAKRKNRRADMALIAEIAGWRGVTEWGKQQIVERFTDENE